MAVDSIRSNKVRAALTIMGVAIGVFVVVAMSSVVRGISESFARDLGRGSDVILHHRRRSADSGVRQVGCHVSERRNPPLTIDEATALERLPTIKAVTAHLGSGAKFTSRTSR
jgi:putative ABC transport system permease protein